MIIIHIEATEKDYKIVEIHKHLKERYMQTTFSSNKK